MAGHIGVEVGFIEVDETLRTNDQRCFLAHTAAIGNIDLTPLSRSQGFLEEPMPSHLVPDRSRGQRTNSTIDRQQPKSTLPRLLVTLDEQHGIAIGLPSMWAKFLWAANPLSGDRILQLAAGSGYYTAILSELFGANGSVVATEIEPHLCFLASKALADWRNVSILNQDATMDFEIEKISLI
ncbi:hypothetical protein IWQ51_006729 [Labrenzia sp. EL_142]|nr:hypothetical protein [Labrenzia sp. EL_142]